MTTLRDALQQALEPSKPLFEFVRMLMSAYLLLGVTYVLFAHWTSLLERVAYVGLPSLIAGAIGLVALNILCFTHLFLICNRLFDLLNVDVQGWWRTIVKAVVAFVLLMATGGIPVTLFLLAAELNRTSSGSPT